MPKFLYLCPMKNRIKANLAKELMKEYKISQTMVSDWANYSNPNSFYTSKANSDVLWLVYNVIKHVVASIDKKDV